MKVSVFGNPDLKEDSLLVKMVPSFKKIFPKLKFEVEDPSEGLKPSTDGLWVILDVAVGIDKIRVFDDLDKLVTEKRVSLHDYDVAMELKLLKKLKKIGKLKIVAVPMKARKEEVISKLREAIENI